MNKCFLIFLLSSCAIIQDNLFAMQKTFRSDEDQSMVSLDKSVEAVINKYQLNSIFADLIAIATIEDLETANYFINNDFFAINASETKSDRSFLFLKALIMCIGRDKNNYARSEIIKRVSSRKEGKSEEDMRFCQVLDHSLHYKDYSLAPSYANALKFVMWDLITLFEYDTNALTSTNVSDSSAKAKSCLIAHHHIAKMSRYCKDIVNLSFRRLYASFFGQITKEKMDKRVNAHKPHFMDQIYKTETVAPVRDSRIENILKPVFMQFSDEELLSAFFLLHKPLAHPVLGLGLLLKMLLVSTGETFGREDRIALIRAIGERLCDQKGQNTRIYHHFKDGLKHIINALTLAFENIDCISKGLFKRLIINLTPERKMRIQKLIEAYRECGFCEEAVKTEQLQDVAISLEDARPLYDDLVANEEFGDVVKMQIADMCDSTTDEAVKAVLTLLLKDVSASVASKQALHDEKIRLEGLVEQDRKKCEELAGEHATLESERNLLIRRQAAIDDFIKRGAKNASDAAAWQRQVVELTQVKEDLTSKLKAAQERKAPLIKITNEHKDDQDVRQQEEIENLKKRLADAEKKKKYFKASRTKYRTRLGLPKDDKTSSEDEADGKQLKKPAAAGKASKPAEKTQNPAGQIGKEPIAAKPKPAAANLEKPASAPPKALAKKEAKRTLEEVGPGSNEVAQGKKSKAAAAAVALPNISNNK